MANIRDILINLIGKETISPAAKKAGESIEDLGDDIKDTTSDAEKLDKKIGELKGSLAGLAAQYAATGDDSFVRQIREQERELRKLTKVRGLLDDADDAGKDLGARLVGGVTKVLPEGLGNAFTNLPGQVQGPVAAAGAAIATTLAGFIGAAVSAGVLLGVGGGVLATGIKLVASNPQVETAAENLKNRFLDIDTSKMEDRYKAAQKRMTFATTDQAKKRAQAELDEAKKALDEANAYNEKNFSLRDAAAPFIGPLTRTLETFQVAADKIIPRFGSMFETLAPLLDKLAPAAVGFFDKALPGIEKAISASVPLFETLAEHMPELGSAITRFFESISSGAPGANSAFGDLLNIIEGTIIALGAVLGALSKLYGGARSMWSGLANVFAEGVRFIINTLGMIVSAAASAFSWIPGLGPKLSNAAKEFAEFQRKANHEIDKITGKTVHVDVTLRGIKNLEEQVAVRLGRRAAGGPVLAGQAYLVGEKGPEILSMGNTSGHIIPNHQISALSGGGGGNTYHVTVNVPPVANPAEVGRHVVESIKAYERGSGKSWRQ